MPRPDPGTFAEQLYAKLAPFHKHTADGHEYTDEELDWPLLAYYGFLAARWQRLHEITADTDENEGWTEILDVDRTVDEGLSYLSQFKGVVLLPGLTPAQQRERIKIGDGFGRCTAEAIKVAAKRRLEAWDLLDRNLFTNPSAEIDTTGVTGVNCSVTRSLDQARSGTASFKLTATAAGDMYAGNMAARIPVTPGEVVSAGAEFRAETTPRACYIFMTFYDAGGTSLGFINTPGIMDSTSAWTREVLENQVAPVNSASVEILAYVSSAALGEVHYVDAFIASPSAETPDYFDGSTTAAEGERVLWDGVAHASASRREARGEPTVFLNEREGGSAYHIGVVTLSNETPDPVLTFRDIVEQKPWGFILNYQVVDAWGYQILKVAFDDYGEVKVHYADYQGLKSNDPPAPTI